MLYEKVWHGMKKVLLNVRIALSLTLVICCVCIAEAQESQRIDPFDKIPTDGKVFAHPICFSHDGKLIAASSYDEPAIRIIEVNTKRIIAKVKASTSAPHLAYSSDGRFLATSGPRGEHPRLWRTKDWSLYHEFADVTVPTGRVFFSADNAIFCASSHSHGIFLWDVKSKKRMEKKIETALVDTSPGVLAPNAKTVAFASRKDEIELVDIETGSMVARWQAQNERLAIVAFSPDSAMLASCDSSGRKARLWKAKDGTLLATLLMPGRFRGLRHLEFSPDGRWLGVSLNWPTVPIFDTKAGRQVFELIGSQFQLEWIAFSPDAETVAAPSRDGTIFLWKLPKDKLQPKQ